MENKAEKKVLTRSQVNPAETWDLSRLFKTEADYNAAITQLESLTDAFVASYQGKLTTPTVINQALEAFKEITTLHQHIAAYSWLHMTEDQTNQTNIARKGHIDLVFASYGKKIVFFTTELHQVDPAILTQAGEAAPGNQLYLAKVIKNQKHQFSPEVAVAMSELDQSLTAPYANYIKFKFADMKFDSFEVEGKTYEQSFTFFENGWQTETNTAIRRAAFENFYAKLGQYENGLANNYQTQVLTEKAHANLKGFNTVFDYLLHPQDMTMAFYDRQIDLLMEHMAVPMRKYVTLLKEVHGLDKLTYADLHIGLDPDFAPRITAAESKQYALDGLAILGDEYREIIEKCYDERWIDFPQSLGRSTGGFCSSPYGKGSFILLNWDNKINEVMVLAHEIGHAGHFNFASRHQNVLNTRCSLYFVEAPSTMNEIIMADYLKSQSDDPRLQRWVMATMISRTYYHNCVTHLLEAHYQREVYRRVEAGQPISASVLNGLMLATIKKFWGDVVEVPDYAGRTWMRQPHYFMGLYPYTYSAGLTIGTAAFAKIKAGELDVECWLDMLRAGGTKNPIELAKMADVDLSTEAPLMAMVNYVAGLVDEITDLTHNVLNK